MNRERFPWIVVLVIATALSILLALYMVFVYVQTERVMGIVQRIFYFHLSSAWVGFLAFFVAFATGLGYLLRRGLQWDRLGVSSIEIGLLFATIALVTGSIWARPTWNTWWTWDPRLTTTLVMWLYYVAVLLLRSMVESEELRARFGAILSIVGFVNVPVVFAAIRLWRTIHPVLFSSEGFSLEPDMLLTLLLSLFSFTLLYVSLLATRLRLENLRHEASQLRALLESGDA
jgi:heme exporter protein C